jgi:hypothetical protein
MSNTAKYAKFMFQLSDLGCSLQVPKLRDTARTLLKLMPAGNYQPFTTFTLEMAMFLQIFLITV